MSVLQVIDVTHTDLDGMGGAVLGILARPGINKTDTKVYRTIYAGYYDIDKQIQELIDQGLIGPETIINIIDITCSKEMLLQLLTITEQVRVFDHHQTADWVAEVLPDLTIDDMEITDVIELYFQRTFVVIGPNKEGKLQSGTSIFGDWLLATNQLNHSNIMKVKNFMETIRKYDTYEWKKDGDLFCKRLQILFSLLGRESFVRKYVSELANSDSQELINEECDMFINASLEKEAAGIQATLDAETFTITVQGVPTLVVFGTNGANISEFSHAALHMFPNLKMVACINIARNAVELRAREGEINTGKMFAKPCNGGGHPPASGFPLPNDIREMIISRVGAMMDQCQQPLEEGLGPIDRVKEINQVVANIKAVEAQQAHELAQRNTELYHKFGKNQE